jgi:hypothetical protein
MPYDLDLQTKHVDDTGGPVVRPEAIIKGKSFFTPQLLLSFDLLLSLTKPICLSSLNFLKPFVFYPALF